MRFACRLLLASFALVAVLVAGRGVARAQVVSGITSQVLRLESDGVTSADTAHPHPGGVPINAVNYSDCAANLEYEFNLAIGGATPNVKLVAWAGAVDCTPIAARTVGTAACYPVIAPQAASGSSATVLVRMQDLALQAASLSSPSVVYKSATADVCTAQPTDAASNVTLYFFFVDQFHNAIGPAAQAYPIVVDTQAALLSGVTVTANDSSFTVNLTSPGDPDITGYNIYCDPFPGHETVVNQSFYDGGAGAGFYDAATNGGQCPPVGVPQPTDAGSDAEDGGAPVSPIPEEGGEEGGADSGALDATLPDAGQPFDAGEPDATTDASLDAGDAGVDSGPISILDDAGGSVCGLPLNDAGVPNPGGGGGTGCYPSVIFAANPVVVAASDSGALTGGEVQSSVPLSYRCGVAGPSDTSATIGGVKNGDYYNVAVAATDAVGNVGPLFTGASMCANPGHIDDFYDRYVDAGGLAGGGFCATEGAGAPGGANGSVAVFLVGLVAAVVAARRRVRRTSRTTRIDA